MEAGWAVSDELELAVLNQAILLRRMWASESDADKIHPVAMPWHGKSEAQKPSTTAEIAAFFGGAVTVVAPS